MQLGREAAAEVRAEAADAAATTISTTTSSDIGERLVRNIPQEFQHNEFRYTFDVVNLREINAFALPGGPMFAHRGMIEKAGSEAEIAGVLAHEISHVALRHGTAQATKAGKYQMGQIGSAILGAIIGGRTGEAVSTVGQFGFGAAFLNYSREYEKQADILGAQIMARTGYDPRAMATHVPDDREGGWRARPRVAEQPSEPGQPRRVHHAGGAGAARREPGAATRASSRTFRRACGQMSPAPTTEEVARAAAAAAIGIPQVPPGRSPSGRVEAPSTRYTTYNEGDVFRIAVPSNWREMSSETQVTFAPEGGYGAINQQSVFTHGVQVGMARNETHDLRQATDELLAVPGAVEPQHEPPVGLQPREHRRPLGTSHRGGKRLRQHRPRTARPLHDADGGRDALLHDRRRTGARVRRLRPNLRADRQFSPLRAAVITGGPGDQELCCLCFTKASPDLLTSCYPLLISRS